MKKNTSKAPSNRDMDSDVSREERDLLKKTDRPETEETRDLDRLALDKTGSERDTNEKSNPFDMGEDLDVPGAELDDAEENIGEEDEENNSYSRRD